MPTYKSEVKDSAIKEWTDAGFPPLNAVVHDSWTPNLLRNFLKKEMAVIGSPYAHVTPLQMEAIFCAVSAANSCELCLTFHAMGLEKHGASKEDINAIVHQGQPTSKDILGHVYCAKLALAHKGVFLEREKEYLLKEFGLGSEHVCEIIYLVGQISANNFLMVHMIANGVPVDDILTGLSPFSKTAYGK
jgi:AhpD family alkylhydroperoxidase|tara:strand:- start:86 stop:652 length:567 start_codon:yes stop_codon:yes gene_type:complete